MDKSKSQLKIPVRKHKLGLMMKRFKMLSQSQCQQLQEAKKKRKATNLNHLNQISFLKRFLRKRM